MEINTPEVYDPGHLSEEELGCVKRMAEARKAGVEDAIEDDPIARGLVNGYIMTTIGQSPAEPGYEDESQISEFPEALKEALTQEKFKLAVKTAKELDPNLEIPEDLLGRFLAELRSWGPERLAEICSEMEKPTINIVPSNSFNDKVAQMDRNKHYEGQNNTFVAEGDDEPYRNVKTVNKVRVFLDDGKPKPSQINDAPIGLEARREFEAKRTTRKSMDYVGPHRAAVLLQQGLIEAEQTGDISKIVDCETITVLNPKNLTDSRYVAYANFSPYFRKVRCDSSDPNFEVDRLRGRASVQVLEF
jgi:hypothetical protein